MIIYNILWKVFICGFAVEGAVIYTTGCMFLSYKK